MIEVLKRALNVISAKTGKYYSGSPVKLRMTAFVIPAKKPAPLKKGGNPVNITILDYFVKQAMIK